MWLRFQILTKVVFGVLLLGGGSSFKKRHSRSEILTDDDIGATAVIADDDLVSPEDISNPDKVSWTKKPSASMVNI